MRTRARSWIVLPLALVSGLTFAPCESHAVEGRTDFLSDRPAPTFDQARRRYVNAEARPFVEDLILRERFLIGLIDEIRAEVNARGWPGWPRSRQGFQLVYRRADSLSREYGAELTSMVTIFDKLDSLERQSLDLGRIDLLWAVRDLKAQVARAVDNLALETDLAQRRLFLLRRVEFELGEVVRAYDRLEGLRREATSLGRFDVVAEIDAAQETLLQAVSTWGKTEPLDPRLVDEYMYELSRLVHVLNGLDELSEAAEAWPQLAALVVDAKAKILGQLDPRVLEAFGYARFSRGDAIPLSQLLDEWKKSQWVDTELARTFHEIIYEELLDSATPAERERMLQRALDLASEAYADGQFALAELRLAHVLQSFAAYGYNLAPARFYRAECLFALCRYQEAMAEYQDLMAMRGVPPSYSALAALRLLCLAHLGQPVEVEEAYAQFLQSAATLPEQDQAAGHFLAGLWHLERGRAAEAAEALRRVPAQASIGLQGRLLLGTALARSEGLEAAKRIFQKLAELRDSPGRGFLEAQIANVALVKMGFIAYEEGDFQAAVDYLEKVRPDLPGYEEALLGLAWAYVKLGDYTSAIPAAEELRQRFQESEYAYEATVLAAHCKRILGLQEDALEDLRYVTNARTVEDLAREWGNERLRLIRTQTSLDSLERIILDRGDAQLYPQLLEAKEQCAFALWMLENPGPAGVRMLQEFNSERSRIASLMARCDRLREAAQQLGRRDVVYQTDKILHRLFRTMETYHGDLAITRVNHFIDYPLALREGTSRYVAAILDSMRLEATRESSHLRALLVQLDSLSHLARDLGRGDVALEAEFLSNRLQQVAGEVNWTQGWVASRDVRVIDADFNRWADFSGFGMSDITLTLLRDREETLARYSEFTQAIDRLLGQRKRELEQSLVLVSERIQRLELELRQLQIQERLQAQQRYFESEYFDRTTSESPLETPQKPSDGQSEAGDAAKHATRTQ
ncbi:MAG: tetratricopeptide repeat protein [candidate division KSB1 bacterium]|nr:tetratricopeptide repeat protein [candidate division KSB1 bacterium]